MTKKVAVLAHNIRSTHNIGSIFRTCEGFGMEELILSGYTPYPYSSKDNRLPHIARKIDNQINKTALGAQKMISWHKSEDPINEVKKYISRDYKVVALEQASGSIAINEFKNDSDILLILGEEVNGVSQELLDICDLIIEIPMKGSKESFNISVATGICLYHLSVVG